jgi:hypothetical protein
MSYWNLEQEDYREVEDNPLEDITNEDFNANLNALKGVYYRLTNEEEDMLNKLFKKYL